MKLPRPCRTFEELLVNLDIYFNQVPSEEVCRAIWDTAQSAGLTKQDVIEALRRYSRRERGLVNWPHSTVYDLECAIKIVEDMPESERLQKETSNVHLRDLEDTAKWHAGQAEYHRNQMAAADVAFPAASLVHAQKAAEHTRFSEAIARLLTKNLTKTHTFGVKV